MPGAPRFRSNLHLVLQCPPSPSHHLSLEVLNESLFFASTQRPTKIVEKAFVNMSLSRKHRVRHCWAWSEIDVTKEWPSLIYKEYLRIPKETEDNTPRESWARDINRQLRKGEYQIVNSHTPPKKKALLVIKQCEFKEWNFSLSGWQNAKKNVTRWEWRYGEMDPSVELGEYNVWQALWMAICHCI